MTLSNSSVERLLKSYIAKRETQLEKGGENSKCDPSDPNHAYVTTCISI